MLSAELQPLRTVDATAHLDAVDGSRAGQVQVCRQRRTQSRAG